MQQYLSASAVKLLQIQKLTGNAANSSKPCWILLWRRYKDDNVNIQICPMQIWPMQIHQCSNQYTEN